MLNTPNYVRKSKGERHGHLIFKSAKNRTGTAVKTNWHELTYLLQDACHKTTTNKLDVELFSPWSPKENSYGRTKDCAESTALLAFDLDKIDTMDAEQISEWCAPYANFVHTTYSHGIDGKGCFRVYVPLENQIPIGQYQNTHAGILETLPEIKARIDLSSADSARCFFMPSCPPEGKRLAKFAISFSDIYAPTMVFETSIKPINTHKTAPPATQGNRNSGLASYAGKVYAQGLTPQEFMQDPIDWGLACQPPMEINEISSVINSMWQTHLRNNPAQMLYVSRPAKYLRSAEDLKRDPPLEWTVRGVLPSHGIGAIYGAPSSGKTFLALDLAFAISMGQPWFGNPTIKKSVAYIALEGSHGIRQRMAAWEKINSCSAPPNLKFVTTPICVEEPESWKAVSNEIRDALGQGAVIFIDTLNRASPTADENTSASMGKIIESAKSMADIADGFVMFVHHAGKDAGKGLRGHSSLLAALDTVIKVGSSNTQRVWSIEKSKDSEVGIGNAFDLNVVELDSKDMWGIRHTSCTVTRGIFKPASKPIRGANQQKVIDTLVDLLLGNPAGSIPLKELEIRAAAKLSPADPKRSKERAKDAIRGLIDSGHINLENGHISPS